MNWLKLWYKTRLVTVWFDNDLSITKIEMGKLNSPRNCDNHVFLEILPVARQAVELVGHQSIDVKNAIKEILCEPIL